MTPVAWKTVHRIEAVAAARYREALSLADIAGDVGRNPSYISALYRKARGRTITSYLTELRVRHAESLLAWESLSVLDIAAASGFGSVSRFYEAFASVTGRRPREALTGDPAAGPEPPVFVLSAVWIDDTPENNIRERRALNAMGIAVDSYVTGEQGLRALAYGGYSLVISDIRRPAVEHGRPSGTGKVDSGWDFAEAVRARHPTIPLLFYCGYDDPARRQHARDVGAVGLFTHEAELLSAVARVLCEDLRRRKPSGESPQSTGGRRGPRRA